MNAAVTFRRIGMNRIADFLALEESCFTCDRVSRRNLRHLLQSPSAYCLGAYRDGKFIGSMIVLFKKNTHVGRIYSLAVSESARGLGVGRGFVIHAEKEARRRGCTRMRLEVRMGNIPAIRVYEELGYEDTKTLPGYYEDGTHALVYWKHLA